MFQVLTEYSFLFRGLNYTGCQPFKHSAWKNRKDLQGTVHHSPRQKLLVASVAFFAAKVQAQLPLSIPQSTLLHDGTVLGQIRTFLRMVNLQGRYWEKPGPRPAYDRLSTSLHNVAWRTLWEPLPWNLRSSKMQC